MTMRRALVAGVGMVPFATPSRTEPYDVMAPAAVRAALDDAGVALDQVQQAYAGYVYGDSTSGQRARRCSLPGRRSPAARLTACWRSGSSRWSAGRCR